MRGVVTTAIRSYHHVVNDDVSSARARCSAASVRRLSRSITLVPCFIRCIRIFLRARTPDTSSSASSYLFHKSNNYSRIKPNKIIQTHGECFHGVYNQCPRTPAFCTLSSAGAVQAGGDGPPLSGTASPVVPRRLLRAGLHGSWSPASAIRQSPSTHRSTRPSQHFRRSCFRHCGPNSLEFSA